MPRIVFIDRGNILRSQIAKAQCNSLQTPGVVVYAYGTHVIEQGNEGMFLSEYPGIAATIEVLKSHGMDISREHCEQLIPKHLKNAAKIIVMTEKEDIPEWLKEYPYEWWDVPNPESVPAQVAEELFVLLKEKIDHLRLLLRL